MLLKISLQQMANLNMKGKTSHLLEKIREYLHDLSKDKEFLMRTPKVLRKDNGG